MKNFINFIGEKVIFYKSFAWFLATERDALQELYGQNWNDFVSVEEMKSIINNILDNKDLRMSKWERNRWKNKLKFTDFNKMSILKIFFDPELMSTGLGVSKRLKFW